MNQINNKPNTALETLKQDETDQQQTKYSTRNTETRSNRSTTNHANTALETLKEDQTDQQQTQYSTIETLKQDQTDQQQTMQIQH